MTTFWIVGLSVLVGVVIVCAIMLICQWVRSVRISEEEAAHVLDALGGGISDVELQALATMVFASAVEVQAANDDRKQQGYAMAYSGYMDLFGSFAAQRLADELKRRAEFREKRTKGGA